VTGDAGTGSTALLTETFSIWFTCRAAARGYLRLHSHTTRAALTSANANVILAGSHYQPCST